ncbi:hypothetical protein RRG08_000610 [Elysia crispata]|uniref:Uncharacterized protein n=1 Tax=Elysia crispata TaxID=231223 RepID=A0AAE0Y9E1_9GAST|nr:hypothetical protein RRG08_000610 [Elysia crispata]
MLLFQTPLLQLNSSPLYLSNRPFPTGKSPLFKNKKEGILLRMCALFEEGAEPWVTRPSRQWSAHWTALPLMEERTLIE